MRPSAPSRAADCRPPTCYTGFYRTLPGRFIGTKLSLSDLVGIAYEMPSNRLVGPDWTTSEHYDIDATHDPAAKDRPALSAMVRHLLEERFSLRVHREQRPMNVYDLALHRQLAPSVERPIVDETGLSGWFALRLDWSDDPQSAASQTATAADIDRPSLVTAMREQLGLMLEAAERPMEVIVIDHIEAPTPN